jgi:hypothetical protein
MRTILISLLAFALAGCAGYKIGPIKPKIMKGVTSIAVPTFKTDILEPRIETLLANVLIRQIQRDGTYKVADEKEADAILTCTLEGLDRRPNRSVNGNQLLTAEYELSLRVSYKLTNRKTGEPIDNRTATGTTFFFATGSNTLASDVNQDEQQAIPLAAADMAEHLVSQIAEGW